MQETSTVGALAVGWSFMAGNDGVPPALRKLDLIYMKCHEITFDLALHK